MNGVLVVDKPAGMTSATVVAKVKRALGVKRVGHTGTLDPMATGVLPVCVGEATKIAGYLLAEDKAYEGELELGVETDTLDADGKVTRRRDVRVSREQLVAAIAELVGDIEQVPPMYSALKRQGKRLHQLARRGIEVEREPRPVHIAAFELIAFEPPRARFRVECSKGTYVRSLAADLGDALGCGAHLTALRRTRSGAFDLAAAVALDTVSPESVQLVDPAEAIGHLPAATIPEERLRGVRDGQRLPWADLFPDAPEPSGQIRLLTPAGALLALVEIDAGRLRYLRVFSYGLT